MGRDDLADRDIIRSASSIFFESTSHLAHPEDQVLILSDDPLRSNLVAKPYVWMEFYSSKGKGALMVQFVSSPIVKLE